MSHPQNPGGNPFDENDSRPGPPDYNRGNNYDPYSHPENSPYSPYGHDPFGAPGYGGNQPGYPTNNYGGPNYGTPMASPPYNIPGAPTPDESRQCQPGRSAPPPHGLGHRRPGIGKCAASA